MLPISGGGVSGVFVLRVLGGINTSFTSFSSPSAKEKGWKKASLPQKSQIGGKGSRAQWLCHLAAAAVPGAAASLLLLTAASPSLLL